MTWTIEDRMLWIGVSRLSRIAKGSGIDALRTALVDHDVDPESIELIGSSLISIADVLYSDDMPAGAKRTRAESALHQQFGYLGERSARDFAQTYGRADLLKLRYTPTKPRSKYFKATPIPLGKKTVDAVCAAFAAVGMPLRGEQGFVQMALPGFEPTEPAPVDVRHLDPVAVMRDALRQIASGQLRGTGSKVATRAMRLVHEIEAARKG